MLARGLKVTETENDRLASRPDMLRTTAHATMYLPRLQHITQIQNCAHGHRQPGRTDLRRRLIVFEFLERLVEAREVALCFLPQAIAVRETIRVPHLREIPVRLFDNIWGSARWDSQDPVRTTKGPIHERTG